MKISEQKEVSAPTGNSFWMNRSKHGRDKLFATPELLWEAAVEYFQWCSSTPWIKKDFKGSEIKEVDIPTERPFTLTGLCVYLGCSSSYFRSFKSTLKKENEHFLPIIVYIEETIQTQQIEGAIVGAFNANIISRLNSLVEKSEIKTDIKIGKDLEDEIYI